MKKLDLRAAALMGAIMLSACQVVAAPPVARGDVESDGREIAQTQCSSCHAVDKDGASPRADAPPFREMAQHYSLSALEVELNNKLPTGHPPMPRFNLAPRGVDALIAYMRSIQVSKAPPDDKPR